MKGLFNPTCGRYGHIFTGPGGSPQIMAPFVFPTAEDMAFLPGPGKGSVSSPYRRLNGSMSKKRTAPFRIGKILVPIDSQHTKLIELKRVIQLARRLNAQITLLHCYEAPHSFSYVQGACAFEDVVRHREQTLFRLQTLCSQVRKAWPKCLCLFEVEPLPAAILRVAVRILADLIVVPAPSTPDCSWMQISVLSC
ncbi:MAG: hypothetical protein C5B58_01965 [Acidobacteria bacterium]|nr:MAG: hypothetical protein C5B58_01965 [Acidobacteriota bacterium]